MHEYLYKNKVTYIEMLCASPCHPTMLSYQLRSFQRSMFDEPIHSAEETTHASGNVTAFMLAWSTVLKDLREYEQVQLPRVGEDLHRMIQAAHPPKPPTRTRAD